MRPEGLGKERPAARWGYCTGSSVRSRRRAQMFRKRTACLSPWSWMPIEAVVPVRALLGDEGMDEEVAGGAGDDSEDDGDGRFLAVFAVMSGFLL